jgi:hypothetical protein
MSDLESSSQARRLVRLISCTVDFSRRRRGVQNEFTAVFRKVPEEYIGATRWT